MHDDQKMTSSSLLLSKSVDRSSAGSVSSAVSTAVCSSANFRASSAS